MEICQVHEIFYSGLKLSDLVSSHLNAKISENTRARVLTRLRYVAWLEGELLQIRLRLCLLAGKG